MPPWTWLLTALAATALIYLVIVGALVIAGRRGDARAVVRFVPDCIVLFGRLLRDPGVSRPRKLLIACLVAYLAMPIDLIPDVVPVAGQLDDAILVAVVLRLLLRGAGPGLVRRHWPGPDRSLDLVLRLAGGVPR